MLRPIYYLLILPLIFFSCIHSKSNPDTSKTFTESADTGPAKKDSVGSSSAEDDPTKDLLVVDGSVRKPFDTLSTSSIYRKKISM